MDKVKTKVNIRGNDDLHITALRRTIKENMRLRLGLAEAPNVRTDIISKYDFLCDAFNNKAYEKAVRENMPGFKQLCSKQVMLCVLYDVTISEIGQFSALSEEYSKIINELGTNNIGKIVDRLNAKCWKYLDIVSYNKTPTKDRIWNLSYNFNTINQTLARFGISELAQAELEKADVKEEIEALKDQVTITDLPYDFESDDEDDFEFTEEPEELEGEPEEEIEGFEEPEEEPEEEEQDPEGIDDIADELQKEIDKEEEEAKSFDEKIKKYKHFEEIIALYINGVMQKLEILYSDGFTGLPQIGLLCADSQRLSANAGAVVYINGEGKAVTYPKIGVTGEYILTVIGESYPDLMCYMGGENDKELVPSTDNLLNNRGICYEMHLGFQSASIKYTKGLMSLRHYITEKCGSGNVEEHNKWLDKNNSGNKSRLANLKTVKDWYRWVIRRVLYRAIMDVYPTVESTQGRQDEIGKLLATVAFNLMNSAVVTEYKAGANMGVRIANAKVKEFGDNGAQQLASAITQKIGHGISTNIMTNVIAKENIAKDVLCLNVILDIKSADSTTLFAAEVLDNLLNSGVRPSWSHCLLGKTEDGQLVFWDDFRSSNNAPYKRCYCIYAGSRSGKGVMTSTLISSALCSGVRVFYTDGKPENGPVIGRVAWEKGLEGYIVDGKAEGKAPFEGDMETYTFGLRSVEKLISSRFRDLPGSCGDENATSEQGTGKLFGDSSLLGTASAFREFAGVMRYLKSMYLSFAIMEARASGKLPITGDDDWNLHVFDEVYQMATNEANLRDIFASYINLVTGKTGDAVELTDKVDTKFYDPDSDKYDEGIYFIHQFNKLCKSIYKSVKEMSSMALGKANSNIIFIFQEADWLSPDLTGKDNKTLCGTILRKTVLKLASTKIIGNNYRTIGVNCKGFGNGNVKNTSWHKLIEKSYWAISDGANIAGENPSLKVFKPFGIWTIAYDKASRLLSREEIEAEEAQAKAQGKMFKTKYFAGYIEALAERFNIDIAGVINSAYTYANDAIKTLGISDQDCMEFIYDCSTFVPEANLHTAEKEEAEGRAADGRDPEEESETARRNGLNIDTETEPEEDSEPQITNDIGLGANSLSAEEFNREVEVGEDGAADPAILALLKSHKPLAKSTLRNHPELASFVGKAKMLVGEALISTGYTNAQALLYACKFSIFPTVLNNKFDYNTPAVRNKEGTVALKSAIAYLSNLWVLGNNFGVEVTDSEDLENGEWVDYPTVKAILRSKIGTPADSNNRFKFACGILDDFDNATLGFGDMPSKDKLKEYISRYGAEAINRSYAASTSNDILDQFAGNVNTREFNYTDQVQADTGHAQRWENTPTYSEPVANSSYSTMEGIVSITNPRRTQDIVRKDTANHIVVPIPSKTKGHSIKKRLFETVKGTSYVFKTYWEEIIKQIKSSIPDEGLITTVTVTEHNIIVNRKNVDVSSMLDGEYGVQMEDILIIRDLFKNFKSLKTLKLADSLKRNIIYEYGDPSVTEAERIALMFEEHRSLQKLVYMKNTGNPRDDIEILREATMSSAAIINKEMGVEKMNMKIAAVAAKNDPKLSKKSPGCTATLWKSGTALGGSLFTRASELKDKSAAKAFGTSLLGAGAIALTAGTSAVTGMIEGPIKLFKHFSKKK